MFIIFSLIFLFHVAIYPYIKRFAHLHYYIKKSDGNKAAQTYVLFHSTNAAADQLKKLLRFIDSLAEEHMTLKSWKLTWFDGEFSRLTRKKE